MSLNVLVRRRCLDLDLVFFLGEDQLPRAKFNTMGHLLEIYRISTDKLGLIIMPSRINRVLKDLQPPGKNFGLSWIRSVHARKYLEPNSYPSATGDHPARQHAYSLFVSREKQQNNW